MPVENRKAIDKLLNAWKDLILIKNNSAPKTNAQKKKINDAIDALRSEFLRLKGVNKPDASYSDAAAILAGAKSGLDDIIKDRKELADALISSAKLLGSLRSVLSLLM